MRYLISLVWPPKCFEYEGRSKATDLTNLATKTALNTKITKIEFITTPEFNRSVKVNFDVSIRGIKKPTTKNSIRN